MKTNTQKKLKASIASLCALILVFATIVGTLAYLTDYEEVTNTFTVGKVDITLVESNVDKETGAKGDGTNTTGNTDVKILPGRTIVKDPTVTVLKDSEECYVRMLVTVTNYENMRTALGGYPEYYLNSQNEDMVLLHNLVNGWEDDVWEFYANGFKVSDDGKTATYEFRYYTTVEASDNDQTLDALFDSVTIPGILTNEQVTNLSKAEILIRAEAIQAEGFADADAAWDNWAPAKAVNP